MPISALARREEIGGRPKWSEVIGGRPPVPSGPSRADSSGLCKYCRSWARTRNGARIVPAVLAAATANCVDSFGEPRCTANRATMQESQSVCGSQTVCTSQASQALRAGSLREQQRVAKRSLWTSIQDVYRRSSRRDAPRNASRSRTWWLSLRVRRARLQRTTSSSSTRLSCGTSTRSPA